jgi:broad specificity phosphatase PhoE
MDPPILLIRHGRTEMLAADGGAKSILDDPLCAEGREQAAALVGHPALAHVRTVLVSPLSRALETAMLAFAERPDVTLHVLPELRELNLMQKADAALLLRHTGRPFSILKDRFIPGPSGPRIVWDPSTSDDHEWWEPHGAAFSDVLPPTLQSEAEAHKNPSPDPPSCLHRLVAFLGTFPERWGGAGPVAIVAHENVFRLLAGVIAMPLATPVPATIHVHPTTRAILMSTLVLDRTDSKMGETDAEAGSDHSHGHARLSDPELTPAALAATSLLNLPPAPNPAPAPAPATAAAPATNTTTAATAVTGQPQPRHAFVLLGCSDPSVF